MKVYVAAKFSEKERVKSVYALLKAAGHTITHDWTINEPSYPFHINPAFTAQCATEDIIAVQSADVFILLTSAEPSMGASTELGAAIASYLFLKRSKIYVVGPYFDKNCFFYHPAVQQIATIEDVLTDMNNLKFAESQFDTKLLENSSFEG